MDRRLGQVLIRRGLLQPLDLEKALELQRERGDKLGRILIDLGFVAQRDVLAALAEQMEIPLVSAQQFPAVSPELEGISPRYMRQFRFLPIELEDSTVTLAMADPLDFETINTVRLFTKLRVRTAIAAEQEILDAIDKYYGEGEQSSATVAGVTEAGLFEEDQEIEHLRDMASEAPVIRLVNAMIAQALERRASDIHIEPY